MNGYHFYCYSGNSHTYSLYTFLHNLAGDSIELQSVLTPVGSLADLQPTLVRYMPPQGIRAQCEAVLKKIGYSGGAVSLDAICKWQRDESGLAVVMNANPAHGERLDGTLGRIRFDPLEIVIFREGEQHRGRQRFTLAHELAHLLLGHSAYMAGERCSEQDFERDGPANIGIEDIVRMEWQANFFASCLLLPEKEVAKQFWLLVHEHGLADRGHGVLFVYNQPCNQYTFYSITDSLRLRFDVSRRAVELRLKGLGLLNDARRAGSGRSWGGVGA